MKFVCTREHHFCSVLEEESSRKLESGISVVIRQLLLITIVSGDCIMISD